MPTHLSDLLSDDLDNDLAGRRDHIRTKIADGITAWPIATLMNPTPPESPSANLSRKRSTRPTPWPAELVEDLVLRVRGRDRVGFFASSTFPPISISSSRHLARNRGHRRADDYRSD
jgi:hypothetical protein